MSSKQMPLVETLEVLHALRTDEVVITNMGTAREWMTFESHPLDWVFVPSSMGQATSLGLGIAIAQPTKKVIICNGDGAMLMNLGSLVTITAQAPKNLTIFIFDNSLYEITGAQSTPASARQRADGQPIQYAEIARACGFQNVHEFDDLDQWKASCNDFIHANELTLVVLKVAPVPGAVGPKSPGPAPARAKDFAAALCGTA